MRYLGHNMLRKILFSFINEDTDAAGEGNPNPHAVEHGDEDGALCCVCFTETDGLSGLDECGHMACEGCWGMYLRNKVGESLFESMTIHMKSPTFLR